MTPNSTSSDASFHHPPFSLRGPRALYALAGLAVVLVGVYVAIAGLTPAFASGRTEAGSPIRLVLALFGVAFLLYLAALALAVRAPEGRGLVATILGGAVAFRLTLLFTTPIYDSDIYRYIWDGNVTAAGVSPYRYVPLLLKKLPGRPQMGSELERVTRLLESPALKTALERLPNPEVPTPYPPVSQAVFALAALLTPDMAPLQWHVLSLKICFAVFDLTTLALLLMLLRSLGRHTGWAVAYGWCPLVIKEVANSGHQDALPVFFTTLGLLLLARALGPEGGLLGRREKARATALTALAALALALGVGAKLYPLALLLLLAATWMRSPGRRRAMIPAIAFTAATLVVCWPLLPSGPPATDPTTGVARPHPSWGVQEFLRKEEMNDFIFRILHDNAKPAAEGRIEPWFVVLPERWRADLQEQAVRWGRVDPDWAPFFVARVITGLTFLFLAGWLALQAARAATPAAWLECAFLTLAWFWLLSPAQYPWYWLWALPLLPFARGRAWLAVSGFAFLYYLRFWFIDQWSSQAVPGRSFLGADYFDYVIVWLEYAPWLMWLALAWALRGHHEEHSGE